MSLGEDRSSLILDSRGQGMQRVAYGDTAWQGASQDRELRDWNPSTGSADADNMWEVGDVRARARDLDRNEPLARGYLDSTASSVIGTGLLPIPSPNWRILGKTKKWADDWSMKVRALAREYLDSTDVDASRIGNFGELQTILFRNVLMSGACCALVCWTPEYRKKWCTSIHLVEVDRLSVNRRGILALAQTWCSRR